MTPSLTTGGDWWPSVMPVDTVQTGTSPATLPVSI